MDGKLVRDEAVGMAVACFDEQAARFDGRFAEQAAHFDGKLAEQAARFNGSLAEQAARFEGSLADLERRMTLRLGGMMVTSVGVVSVLARLL